MAYTLPELPYGYDALEPHIDAETMKIHHTKHHQAYVDKVNKALEGTEWADTPIEDVLQSLEKLPADKKAAVRNNGGGHYNHSLFWTVMSPPSTGSGQGGGGKPEGDLLKAIEITFGSFEDFQKKFEETAVGQFGSGWAWLYVDDGKMFLKGYSNQDSPVMEGKTPILGLDVWEHAYYLKYQNKRPDYAKAFWNVVNWPEVSRRTKEAC